jgi:DNA-binding response OmpR family regulator
MLLVIEPVDDVRELLVRFLCRQGVEATGCAGPAEASRCLRGGQVAIVIVSYDRRTGLPYACPELRGRDAPVTIVLGTSALDEHELGHQLGNFHCVQMKPFEPWQLYGAVVEASHQAHRGTRLVSGFIHGGQGAEGAHRTKARGHGNG